MIAAVLLGFFVALVAPWLSRALRGGAGWALALLPAALTVYFAAAALAVTRGEVLQVSAPWVPTLGFSFSFLLDGLSLLFALLITGIGTVVFIYAGAYMGHHPLRGRLFAALMAFMAAMLGLVTADNVFTLFVFWELTSFASYILIGFDQERAEARAAALQALLVTGLGGLALLAGLVLLGRAGGSFELSVLLTRGDSVRADPLYAAILLLVLGGAFTKSAQVPFHFWLPNAMEAPTPVSAYLHSSTMVKAGVYLLARLAPVLGGTDLWQLLVVPVGGMTMVAGAALAYVQTDLKRVLAYSTISALGTLVLLIGLNTPPAITAAVVFLAAHALYKGALFLMAGAVAHETGERDVTRLGGLRHAMPVTAAVAAVAALSMAGVPPLLGFLGKELMLEAVPRAGVLGLLATGAAVGAAALQVAVALFVGFRPFLGAFPEAFRSVHEGSPGLWIGAAILAMGSLAASFVPQPANALLGAAASAVRGEPTGLALSLWHGFTPTLALSVLALAGGAALHACRPRLHRSMNFRLPASCTAGGWYEASLSGLNRIATAQTRFLQSGYLRLYLVIIVAATVGTTMYTLLSRRGAIFEGASDDASPVEIALAVLILVAALGVVRSGSRLGAVTLLGVVGYGVALAFGVHGAPDLAMTQFIIETLTVVLFVLVVYHVPANAAQPGPVERLRDVAVAAAAGVMMSLFVLVASRAPIHPPISSYFGEHSLTAAHGRNIVNVILVDFRALDTLGEISVLALAGVGVYALAKLRGNRKEEA